MTAFIAGAYSRPAAPVSPSPGATPAPRRPADHDPPPDRRRRILRYRAAMPHAAVGPGDRLILLPRPAPNSVVDRWVRDAGIRCRKSASFARGSLVLEDQPGPVGRLAVANEVAVDR